MRTHPIWIGFVVVGALAIFWNSSQAAKKTYDENAARTDLNYALKKGVKKESNKDDRAVLRTQQFENGELLMKDVESDRLEMFLQDLHHRRDYDMSQHQGKPGPDHAYLSQWVNKSMDELFDRGYYVDKYGDLRRPGDIVPTR